MAEGLKSLLEISEFRKKYLLVYLKGVSSPLCIAIADTEATYRKIKKHLSSADKGTLMRDILEKKLIDNNKSFYTIPLDQVIAVGIQDLTQDYSELL